MKEGWLLTAATAAEEERENDKRQRETQEQSRQSPANVAQPFDPIFQHDVVLVMFQARGYQRGGNAWEIRPRPLVRRRSAKRDW